MKLTPTENIIVGILSDGFAHKRIDLLSACDSDGLMESVTLQNHISNIRKKVRPVGRDVIFQRIAGVSYYRLVKL